jgi:ABC-type nitrate/sulfonate/bicarbonate transport system permease component
MIREGGALIGAVVGEFQEDDSGGRLGDLVVRALGALDAADMMVALVAPGLIGVVVAPGIEETETRRRRRPEYRRRA